MAADLALTKEDDQIILEEFSARLAELVDMREEGRADGSVFDAYEEALVQLTDDGLKEMYLNFMLIYLGNYTPEVLERCGIGAVTEKVLGFAEMQTIKIGGLLDTPRANRITNLKRERTMREQKREEEARRAEEAAAKACLLYTSPSPRDS